MPNLNNYDNAGSSTIDTIHLILLIDTSYSMKGSRIAQVNNAIPQIKQKLRKLAFDNDVDLIVRVIAFSDEPTWVVGTEEEGVPIDNFTWKDLTVESGTSTNKAVREAAKALHKRYLTKQENAKILRPVVILLTDGYCNPNEHSDYLAAIEELKQRLAGNTGKDKITRIAIGVENYNRAELEEFASLSQPKTEDGKVVEPGKPLVFEVTNTEELGSVIDWLIPTSIVSSILSGSNPDLDGVPFPDTKGPTKLIL